MSRLDKEKVRIKTFKFPVFANYEIVVVSAGDIRKAMSRFKHTRNVDMSNFPTADGFNIHVANEPTTYIFIPTTASLGLTTHEAYHAVDRMLKFFHVEENDEVIAYHLGYLVQEISEWRWSWK
jgi:hypothetical protein